MQRSGKRIRVADNEWSVRSGARENRRGFINHKHCFDILYNQRKAEETIVMDGKPDPTRFLIVNENMHYYLKVISIAANKSTIRAPVWSSEGHGASLLP